MTAKLIDGKQAAASSRAGLKEQAARLSAAGTTPGPGGVGPMTITMLLHNTVESAQRTMQGDDGDRTLQ